jgi:hypothetical protein
MSYLISGRGRDGLIVCSISHPHDIDWVIQPLRADEVSDKPRAPRNNRTPR